MVKPTWLQRWGWLATLRFAQTPRTFLLGDQTTGAQQTAARLLYAVLPAHCTGEQAEDVVGVLFGAGHRGFTLTATGEAEVLTFWDNLRIGLNETLPDLMRVLLTAKDADHVEDAWLAHETPATLAWGDALNAGGPGAILWEGGWWAELASDQPRKNNTLAAESRDSAGDRAKNLGFADLP